MISSFLLRMNGDRYFGLYVHTVVISSETITVIAFDSTEYYTIKDFDNLPDDAILNIEEYDVKGNIVNRQEFKVKRGEQSQRVYAAWSAGQKNTAMTFKRYNVKEYRSDDKTKMETKMTTHKVLPITGYKKEQSSIAVDYVNANKQDEERILRRMDDLRDIGLQGVEIDYRFLAIARTHLELAYMAFNRAVFNPERVKLDTDESR